MNEVLWRIFGPKREEISGSWKNCIKRSSVLHYKLFGMSN
jgi:hypothetical protein